MKVGVLALQGDVPEHVRAVEPLLGGDVPAVVRTPADLVGLRAVLLPGGESTTIGRLLDETGLRGPLTQAVRDGLGILATCAGLVLLARTIEPSPGGRDPTSMGLLDVVVRRNDYGRQRESFEAPLRIEGLGARSFPGVFIRSPRILQVGAHATPIAWHANEVVGVRAGNVWGLTFHPELAGDARLHELFLRTLEEGPRATSPARAGRAPARPRSRR